MLRQKENEGHDPKDVQVRRSRNYIFNPCFFIPVTRGAKLVGIYSILIAFLDIVLTYTLEKSVGFTTDVVENETDRDPFRPYIIPYVACPFFRVFERYGCAGVLLFTSMILVGAIIWANTYCKLMISVLWIGFRCLCFEIRAFLIGALLQSDVDVIRSRSYEILVMEAIEAYFMLVVVFYSLNVYNKYRRVTAGVLTTGNCKNIDQELHIGEIIPVHGPEANTDLHLEQKIGFLPKNQG